MKMCTVLPIPSFAGTLSRPIGTYIVNLRRANCQTLLRGHRRRDGMERVGVREMRPHSDLQKSGIDNADLRTEGVYSLRKRLSTGQQDANRPSFRRPDSSFESGFSQSQSIAEFKSAILRTEGVHSLRKRLSTGQQDANEPSCRRPDSSVESGFSQSQYIADFKSAILRTEGFTPSENISNNESSRTERHNTQRAPCPDSLHLSLRGAKRRGNLTSMINRRSPAPVCRLTGWTKAQQYGGGSLPPQTSQIMNRAGWKGDIQTPCICHCEERSDAAISLP